MRLARQPGDAPTGHDPSDAVPLRGTYDVDHLVLCEDVSDLHLLLEEARDEVDLLLGRPAVDLNFLYVGLLAAELHLGDLGVADCADHLAILLRPGDL
eukprot:CAMPEP_0117495112 /NCGR_PEP_ID=MMETSP0784-20121206/19963_1 /TAXON_ID=39447 /ORGANISM="" /LENGTH=97 /DNA_ID=CAMNT_0005290021 /DNA_START=1 /DNA_END=291 /DNA_ORIENTATION=+